MVPPGGFSRGEQFERERVAPPLSRTTFLPFCRSKKGRPRWQALAESRLENRRKGYNRVSITTSRYHPIRKQLAFTPLAPSVTANAVPAPSRRELWGAYLATLDCCSWGSANCESLSHLRCQLPLAREPWGAVENKGPVVLLAAVVKPRLFRCKLRFHEMPRQGLSCRGLSVVFAAFSEGYKEEQGKQG